MPVDQANKAKGRTAGEASCMLRAKPRVMVYSMRPWGSPQGYHFLGRFTRAQIPLFRFA